MYIMRGLKQTRLGSMIGLFGREVAGTFDNLGVGNLAVFGDIYWQHMAYEQGGLPNLRAYSGRAGSIGVPFKPGARSTRGDAT